jgi:hypothetical protein
MRTRHSSKVKAPPAEEGGTGEGEGDGEKKENGEAMGCRSGATAAEAEEEAAVNDAPLAAAVVNCAEFGWACDVGAIMASAATAEPKAGAAAATASADGVLAAAAAAAAC